MAQSQSRKGEPREPRHGGGPKALADSLRKVTSQALGQRSLAERSLILDWPSIAGHDLARLCVPQGLSFPKRDRRLDGTLTLKVRPGQATRLQHLEPQLIERINGTLGYRAVARLRLVQASSPAAGPAAGDPQAAPEAPETAAEAPENTQGQAEIDDPALRAALTRLGRAVKQST